MNETVKRGLTGFAMSALIGCAVNLIIDVIVNATGFENFMSMSPEFRNIFPTPVIAAYVNVLLYGIIGATFSMMTYIYEVNRIGFLIQSIIYILVTGTVAIGIAVMIWQLHHYPKALISTIAGYVVSYLIVGILEYKKLREDIKQINEVLA